MPKLCLVIFAILNFIIHCLADFVAIIFVPSGNELFECDFPRSRETQLLLTRRGEPDFIFLQIPLPHSKVSGVRGQVEPLLANFQFTRETRGSSHVTTQLIRHRRDDPGIGEAEEERDIDNSPDHQGDMPRENRAKDHAAADQQGASPIPASPHGDCGVHAEDKQQEQTDMTKQTPWVRNADRHRDDLTCPGKVANICDRLEVDAHRKNEIEDQH